MPREPLESLLRWIPGSGLPIWGGGLGVCISNKSQVVVVLLLLVPRADTTLRQDPEGSSC